MTEVQPVCRLDVFDGAQTLRYEALLNAMHAAVEGTRELPDGYAVRVPSDPALFLQVAAWITLERRCCPFLSFGLDWSASEAVWLRLTGGAAVKAFLAKRLAHKS